MNPFDNPSPAKERVTGKHIALVLVLAIAVMAPLGWMVYQQRVEAAAKVEAARVAAIQKEQASQAIAAMMVNLPQRTAAQAAQQRKKGRVKMVKILRGTSGQADSTEQIVDSLSEGDWVVYPRGDIYAAGWYNGETGNENGWMVSPTGSITVPSTATPGVYDARYGTSESPPDEPAMNFADTYEFEVTCMKITIIGLTPVTP